MRFLKAVLVSGLIAWSVVVWTPGRCLADTLYGTTDLFGGHNRLFSVDTQTNVVTTVLAVPAADSLLFDTSGRIIFTSENAVRRFDPKTNTNVPLAVGFGGPADLALEPGGGSVLVSDFPVGRIARINLTTNAVSTLVSGLTPDGPEGLIYDNKGRLFANIGARNGGPMGKFVVELDPTTGAILRKSPGLNSLDGLTFDPVSGKLYAGTLGTGFFYAIDPNNLANVTTLSSSLLRGVDGLTADGQGNIFLAEGRAEIIQYDVLTNTFTPGAMVAGLDDLAPAVGPGAPPVPEPSSFMLAGLGLLGLLVQVWWRRHQATR
jgi:sugar lactone lactonase YvrE